MIQFTGLATGLDTGAIIDQLYAAERAPARVLETQQSNLESRKTIVSDLSSKMTALKDVADGLLLGSDVRSMTATSNDEDTVGVTVSSLAQNGTYSLNVSQLAQAQTTTSRTFATKDPGVVGTGSVTLTVGTDAPVQIDYSATDSLADIAERINDSDARAGASVMFDGTSYRLIVTASETGVANAVSFSETGDALGLADPLNEVATAQDAAFTLNGIAVTSASNRPADVLSGVTLELERVHQAGEADTVIEVSHDTEGALDKAKELVDAFNAVAGVVDDQLRYDDVTKGANTLFGDSLLRGLQLELATMVTTAYPNGSGQTSLAQLGITLESSGKVTLDESKFTDAIEADPEALSSLLAGDGVDGMAKKLVDMVDTYTRAGDGLLVGKNKSMDSQIDAYEDQIEQIESNAEAARDRLEAQFTALEQMMIQLQTQQTFLANLTIPEL